MARPDSMWPAPHRRLQRHAGSDRRALARRVATALALNEFAPPAPAAQGSTWTGAAAFAPASATAVAMSSDGATASFALVSRHTPLPVRVHVQWRGRMADVWIGLHRQAFERLPDIRAGIEDWVDSRGGAIGHLVCNGETLAGAAVPTDIPGEP